MCESNTDFENEIIERIVLGEYIKQFEPKVQSIFYDAYGKSLEAMPKKLLQLGMSMERFLEGLLKLRHVTSQKIVLLRFGFVTGSTMTLQEVADALDIARERVRQIESMFLRRFISHMCHKRILDYYREE